MEKMFEESKVREIINKAILEGKIHSTKYFINWIDSEIEGKEEWFEHLNENSDFRSERWIECNSSLQTLHIVKDEFTEVLKLLEEENTKNN